MIEDEDPDEEMMDIDDIAAEPIDSAKINRCGKCRRVQYGHPVPYGAGRCILEEIANDEDLKRDDEVKLEMRRKKRTRKRSRGFDDVTEPGAKKEKNEEEELLRKNAEFESKLEEKRKEREKIEKDLKNKKIKDLEEKSKKIKRELQDEDERIAKALGGGKPKSSTGMENKNKKEKSLSQARRKDSPRRDFRRSPEKISRRWKSPEWNRRDQRGDYDWRDDNRDNRRSDYHGRGERRIKSPRRPQSSRWMESPRREWSHHRRNQNNHRNERESSYRKERSPRRSASRRLERSPSGRSVGRHESTRVPASALQEITQSMVEAVREVGDKKLEPPPTWDEGVSLEGWIRSVEVWSKNKARPEKKTQALLEALKKEKREGVKEMVIAEFIENQNFCYEDIQGVEKILRKIKEWLDESKWKKVTNLIDNFCEFKQNAGEKYQEYVGRFSTLEVKLKNQAVIIPNLFMAAFLMKKSRLTEMEKSNVLATTDVENEENVLKILKKKIRDVDAQKNNDAHQTLYGDWRGKTPDKSNYHQEDKHHQERNRFPQGGGKSPFRGNSNTRNRSNSRHRSRSFSRGKERFNQPDGREQNRFSKSPKRTYCIKTLKLDKRRTIFQNDVVNRALLDSGCPEMVAGEGWIKTYESFVGKEFKDVDRTENYQFGNEVFPTIAFKEIPIRIGNLEETVEVGVIDTNLPLLISNGKLKEWGAKMDFGENKLFFRKSGEDNEMVRTKSGHLAVELGKDLHEDSEEVIQAVLLMKKEKLYSMKKLKKIHRVFGHPGNEKLTSLLEDAGQMDGTVRKILKKIQGSCSICKRYKRKASKPKVGLPKAREINHVVSIDLKPVKEFLDNDDEGQIVYMVDEFSKWTVAGISKNKEAENVGKVVLEKWCLNGPGYPVEGFFMDNGKEFMGGHLKALCKKVGAKIKLTPSYSPWSNGSCERRHGVIDLAIKKIMADERNVSAGDALNHAVWARNMEIGRHGLSPFQVMYGRAPRVPGILDGNLVTDGKVTESEIMRHHFRRQEKAREALRQADASSRLKEAIKSRIQPYLDQVYERGDQVLFLNKDDEWDGPGKVQATESKTVWITHNGQMKKVASCRLRPWTEDQEESDEESTEEETTDDDESDWEEPVNPSEEVVVEEVTQQRDAIADEEVKTASKGLDELIECGKHEETRPTRGSQVIIKLKNGKILESGYVKHVGKKSTPKKSTCWIECEDKTRTEEIDFAKEVDSWKYLKKNGVNFAGENIAENQASSRRMEDWKAKENSMDAKGVFYLSRESPIEVLATLVPAKDYNKPEIQDAMEQELQKWKTFGAYQVVEDVGQEAIDGRWLVHTKDEYDGLKVQIKARYCLRGFKEHEKPRSDSPTVDRMSTKILYAVAAQFPGWELESIDVTSAFLQGDDLDREIFVKPPKEAMDHGFLWRMKKAAYGLYDASRRWWIRVIEFLLNLGGKTMVGDESLIYFHKDGYLRGLVAIHVDDFQGAGDEYFKENVMDKLAETFKISKREYGKFKYTGVDVELCDDGAIILEQEAYKDGLKVIPVDLKEDPNRNLNKKEFKEFRGAAGKISWLADMTRPDLAYDSVELSGHNKDAKVKDLKAMNKLIERAKKTSGRIRFSKVSDNIQDAKILAICDASHLRREEKTKGVMGRFIFLSDQEERKVCPIVWKSKTIATVCKSAKSAETRSADKCIEEAVYVARCMKELLTGERGHSQLDVDVRTDSKSLIDSIDSSRQIDDKLLRPTVKWIKQMLDGEQLRTIRWVDGTNCIADILTKPGAPLTQATMNIMKTGDMIDLEKSKKKAVGEIDDKNTNLEQ